MLEDIYSWYTNPLHACPGIYSLKNDSHGIRCINTLKAGQTYLRPFLKCQVSCIFGVMLSGRRKPGNRCEYEDCSLRSTPAHVYFTGIIPVLTCWESAVCKDEHADSGTWGPCFHERLVSVVQSTPASSTQQFPPWGISDISAHCPNLSRWAIISKSDLSKLPGNFTSHKCFFDIYDVCSKTAGRKQQMETETGRKWGNAMGKSVKKRFQFRILVCGTPFCCSCLSSRGGCHRCSLVWASCLIPISASHLVWFWPGGLCWEPLPPGLT